MILSFDINDDELNEIVSKGIKNLSEETVTDRAKKAIMDYISTPNIIEKIIFDKNTSYYSNDKEPRKWFTEMLAKSFTDKEIESYRQALITCIEDDGKDILIRTIASVFSDMLINNDMRMQFSNALYELADIRSKLNAN